MSHIIYKSWLTYLFKRLQLQFFVEINVGFPPVDGEIHTENFQGGRRRALVSVNPFCQLVHLVLIPQIHFKTMKLHKKFHKY